ncbi:MAG: TPM domain-containing protein [Candidatus Gracilibacteria bacterium]|nr:TPM domain-containing protein [Candidatus Gracilibacteria bacterium]
MKKILLSLFLFFVCSPAYSFDISSLGAVHSSVVDTAGVLKPEQKLALESKIADLRKRYTVEILTIIVPSMNGEDISSAATEIGQKVGVGKADKDNGLVLLIAINDRAWNIATGYGVEGVLPDLLTKKIGEKNFVLFKNGQYFEGIMGSFDDFDRALSGDTSVVSIQSEKNGGDQSPWFILQFMIALAVSSLFFKPLVSSGKLREFFRYAIIAYIVTLPLAYLAVPGIFALLENIGIWIIGSLFGIFGKSGRGGGGSSSSGGSSGITFGGGSFGGGGSSGKW